MQEDGKVDAPLVPLVLAGGRGSRLWPVSREVRPKQFLRVRGQRSLLQEALLRAAAVAEGHVIVATSTEHRFQLADEVRELDTRLAGVELHLLLEPVARDTGAAICAANQFARALVPGDETVLLVLPSDHLVEDHDAFTAAIARARASASSGRITVLGAPAASAETAFGYLRPGRVLDDDVREVEHFVEKPSRAAARRHVRDGKYLWNTGILCARCKDLDAAFAHHAPRIHRAANHAWAHGEASGTRAVTLHAGFAQAPDLPVDRALLERCANLAVVETDMGWSDIGSWDAMRALATPDRHGNRVLGEAVLVDCADTYVRSDSRLVAAVGVEGLVIVDTPDALLVGRGDDMQKVRDVVARLEDADHASRALHRTVHRPWGTFTVVEEGERHKIKRLHVKPGCALSLQLHHHRNEHWVVLQGTAQVTNGDSAFLLERDQSTYIPAGNRHRLVNPGPDELVIVETQTGDYLGEDDIVRLDDDYGRAGSRAARQATGPAASQPAARQATRH